MIALSGVRSSCDMLARNSDLCLLATSSWALFSWISLKSRTFSIAIAAWSAKVLASAICFSLNGRTSVRRRNIVPNGLPSRISGTASMLWCWPNFCARSQLTG